MSLFMTTSAFAIDCFVQLTFEVNTALDQHEQDLEMCDNVIIFKPFCTFEANVAKDAAIDAAVANFNNCCCLDHKACCHP